jgi:hypothetical protein
MSLFRTAARASVATHVVGNTHRRQQQRWAAQDTAAKQPAPATVEVGPSTIEQLTQLGQLRDSGVLTETEFEAQKKKVLSAS